jgi:hypothetical protein
LECFERVPCVTERVHFRECLQPRLAALLAHDAIGSPRCESVIKSFVGRSDRLFVLKRHPGVVEAGQVAHAIVRGSRHDPRVASFAQHVGESIVVLEKKSRLRRQRLRHFLPIDRIRLIDIEIRDDRLPLQSHIRLGREICLLDVLQLADQGLLRRTSGARIPLDRALVDHDRERKARVSLGLCHHQLRRLIDAVVRAVPVNDDAINSAADHVCDLTMNLSRVR